MSDVPKIVPERLRAAGSRGLAGAHPDADVLTAFAEQALSAAERERVLEHLALCGDCREVVALGLPPLEAAESPKAESAEEVVAAGPAAAGFPRARETRKEPTWFTWPRLTWAALAAGVVVAAVLVLHPGKQPPSVATVNRPAEDKMAEKAAPSAPAAADAAQPRAKPTEAPANEIAMGRVPERKTVGTLASAYATRDTAGLKADAGNAFVDSEANHVVSPAPTADLRMRRRELANKDLAKAEPSQPGLFEYKKAAPAANEKQSALTAATATTTKDSRVAAGAGATPAVAAAPAPVRGAFPGSVNETVEVTGAAPTLQTDQVTIANKTLVADNRPPAVAAVSKAKPATTQDQQVTVSAQSQVVEVTTETATVAQNVTSPATNLAINGRNYTQLSVIQAGWKIESGTLKRSLDNGSTWHEVLVAKHQLICYSEHGAEIWAGGKVGMLFRSADGGVNWNKVHPMAGHEKLTSDVTAIAYGLAGEIVVTAGGAESWATLDSGKTWTKK